jgi:DNA polymerase-1
MLQVHDELVVEVPRDDVDATAQILCDEMSAAYALDVPLVVDLRTGTNWDEMTRIKLPAATHA